MHPNLIAIPLTLAVMAAPVRTLAAHTQAPNGTSEAAQAPATHATRGIVRTIDATTLVIHGPEVAES